MRTLIGYQDKPTPIELISYLGYITIICIILIILSFKNNKVSNTDYNENESFELRERTFVRCDEYINF